MQTVKQGDIAYIKLTDRELGVITTALAYRQMNDHVAELDPLFDQLTALERQFIPPNPTPTDPTVTTSNSDGTAAPVWMYQGNSWGSITLNDYVARHT